jgi:PAS domain S-box-containing protein
MRSRDILRELRAKADPSAREGMARFGIATDRALGGTSVPALRAMAKRIGRDHDLAAELWASGIHEARLLAAMVDDPARVTEGQMEAWAADFDSWDMVDGACSSLFDKTPFAYDKAVEWSGRDEEFVKRAGFVLMAVLAVHDKSAPDETFRRLFPLIEAQAGDRRNFVRKAVNWALRQIGKRNPTLNREAVAVARRIQSNGPRTARWVASDALRELESEAVRTRLHAAGRRQRPQGQFKRTPPQGDGLGMDDAFSRFVQGSPDGVLITRRNDGLVLEANPVFLRMSGWRREQILGRTTLQIGMWEDPAARSAMVAQIEKSGSATGVGFRLRSSTGEPMIVEATVVGLRLGDEDCIVFAARDVRDRERAAAELRQSHDMLRATIDSTTDGILVADSDGRIIHANARFAEMWRMPPDLLAAGTEDRLAFVLDQLVDPDAFLADVRDLYASDRESFDSLHFNDGRVFERYSRPLRSDGEVAGRVWSFRDVTEARQTGEAMRSAETKYRTLIEQIPAITYIDAVEGPVTTLYISPQTEGILGYKPSDWFEDPYLLSKRIHPEDHDRWRAEVDKCEETGEPFRLEYRILGRDGRVVWVHDESIQLRDDGGRPLFWQGVMFDITERKEAEEKLEQAWQREMEAAQRLRALDEMKNTFLEAVSHELRTPLTAILGSALTLEREDLALAGDEEKDLVRRLAANARKLNRLLSDLLDLDRLARGIVEPKRQLTDVASLTRHVVEDIEQGGTVKLDVEPVEVLVDPAKVERIVENLVANAIRHTPADTDVWVRVRSYGGGVLISVEDSGPGIPTSDREAIFEPFRQLRGDQAHSPGVGIGLSLVARFAEIHGGRAWVEDRPGGGSSFRVFLPGQFDQPEGAFESPEMTETARA